MRPEFHFETWPLSSEEMMPENHQYLKLWIFFLIIDHESLR